MKVGDVLERKEGESPQGGFCPYRIKLREHLSDEIHPDYWKVFTWDEKKEEWKPYSLWFLQTYDSMSGNIIRDKYFRVRHENR